MKRNTTRKSKKNENSFVQDLLLQILKTIPQSMMNALVIGGVIIALIVGAYFLLRNSNVSIGNEATVKLSPTTIEQMEAIGQWEFLAISDEEIADTVRKGIFSDDELVRIYKGTLRLGIDMADARKDWIRQLGDTVTIVLPPVKLLDENFLDEAATKSFYETGKWSQQARKQLAEQARRKMPKRCMTKANIETARQNAVAQFRQMISSMGFKHIDIKISSTTQPKTPSSKKKSSKTKSKSTKTSSKSTVKSKKNN